MRNRASEFKGRERLVAPKVELRNDAKPHDLILRSDAEHRVSKDVPARSPLEHPSRPLRDASG
jgi:hypothetical protein